MCVCVFIKAYSDKKGDFIFSFSSLLLITILAALFSRTPSCSNLLLAVKALYSVL